MDAAYNFGIRQRCQAHILREAEYAINDPLTHLLYERLYYQAKTMQDEYAGVPKSDITSEDNPTIATEYRVARIGFTTKLENIAENMYTFVRYSGMDPTKSENTTQDDNPP